MSHKVDPFNRRKRRRYTKKTLQFGGAGDTYTVISTINPQDAIGFLSKQQIPNFTVPKDKQKKVTKITIPKSKKSEFESKLNDDLNIEYKQTCMCMMNMNCDYLVTTPIDYTFTRDITTFFTKPDIIPEPLEYRTEEVTIPADKLNTIKYAAKKFKFIVKDAKGNSLPQMNDNDFKTFEMGLAVSDVKSDTTKNANVSDMTYTDIKYDEQKFADLYHILIASNPIPFKDVKDEGKKEQKPEFKLKSIIPIPSDQRKKEELFSILSEIDKKMEIFCSLASVNSMNSVQANQAIMEYKKALSNLNMPQDEVTKTIEEIKVKLGPNDCLSLKHALVKSVASDIFVIQDSFANEATTSESEIKKMDFIVTKNLADSSGWWLGKLPLFLIDKILDGIRSSMRNYGKMSFNTDEAARKMLNQKRADALEGVKNEFSLASAFIGTEAQKTSAQAAVILGVATTCWTIVGKVQQNPALAAIIMGAVSATGIGGIAVGCALIGCGVAYYAVLKLKEKYNSYYEINRSLNELTILLHRIQKLIRLSVLVSNTYNFDIAFNEIVEQLKILFSRFDEMLKQDDYNGIQGMINENATPDLDMVQVVEKAAVDAQKENTANATISNQEKGLLRRTRERISAAAKTVGEAFKRAGKNIGSFIYVMTFDEELWYRKLNNDIIKLNIYLTTTIGEFNLVLNVLQMGYITKGFSKNQSESSDAVTALTAKQKHIQDSSEYMRMLIGILLNDILKLRVDLSYCSRKNLALIVKVSTKDEPICLGYQDTDGAGNIVTTFRRQLHAMVVSLVERLNDKNSVYSTSKGLKEKVFQEVVTPYLEMFGKVQAVIMEKLDGNKEDFKRSVDKEQTKLKSGEEQTKVINTSGGGGDGSSSAATVPASTATAGPDNEQNMMIDKIVKYVVSEPYNTIPDNELTAYLNKVYLFSKKEGKTTEAETKQAIETAKEVAEIAPSAEAVMISSQTLADQAKANTEENVSAELSNSNPQTVGGGRLTRKRIFKLKKNRRITRIRPPFKSAAVAVAAFRRK